MVLTLVSVHWCANSPRRNVLPSRVPNTAPSIRSSVCVCVCVISLSVSPRFGYVEWVDLVIGASTADTNAYRVSFRVGDDARRALDALPFVELGVAPPHDFALLSHDITDDNFCKLISERATTNPASSTSGASASNNGRLTSSHADHATDGRLPVSHRGRAASPLPTSSAPLPPPPPQPSSSAPLPPPPPPPPRDPRARPAANDTGRAGASVPAPYDPRARPTPSSTGAASSSTDSRSADVRGDSRRESMTLRDDATRQIDAGAASSSSATTSSSTPSALRDPLPPFKCAAIRIPLRILRFALRFKNVALNTAGLVQLAWPTEEFRAASDVLVLFNTVADAESAMQRFEAENSAGLVFLAADAKIPPVEVVDKMALGPHECDKAPSVRHCHCHCRFFAIPVWLYSSTLCCASFVCTFFPLEFYPAVPHMFDRR